jgi:hypothetical protein
LKVSGGWIDEQIKAGNEFIVSKFGGDLHPLVHCKEEIHNNIHHNKANVMSVPAKPIQT